MTGLNRNFRLVAAVVSATGLTVAGSAAAVNPLCPAIVGPDIRSQVWRSACITDSEC